MQSEEVGAQAMIPLVAMGLELAGGWLWGRSGQCRSCDGDGAGVQL